MIKKICTTCDNELPETEEYFKFRKDRGYFDTKCKNCQNTYSKKYYQKNKEKISASAKVFYYNTIEKQIERGKKYYENNKDKISEINKKYYENNKVKISEQTKIYQEENIDYVREIKRKSYYKNYNKAKKYRENNKDKISEINKNYREKNKDKMLEYRKKWGIENRVKMREYFREYYKHKIKTDPLYVLTHKIRSIIRNSFINRGLRKSSTTSEILGCSFEYFKTYLESNFENWMNWDNKGLYNGELNYGWDIDHIIPISTAKTEEDVIRLNHYTNLQPLCSKINRDIKIDKLNYY